MKILEARRRLFAFILLLATSLVSARRRLPNEIHLNATDFGRHLIGTNVDVPVATFPDDHLVTDLPLLDKSKFPTDHWAGLLPASSNGDKYLFYWMFAPPPSTKDDKDIPLIIWLNGGPACSSMDGLWIENGPLRLKQRPEDGTWTIDIADHSWHNTPAYVVYIDQPVGTGISFTTSGKYPTNDHEVNVDFYYFLKEFLSLHSDKFLEGDTLWRKLFFSGESHAGHYIPSMMNFIRKQNLNNPTIQIPLAGAAIGNGWMDPMAQYSAHEAGYGYSLIGLSQKRALEEKERKCQKSLASGNYVVSTCFELLDDVVANSQGHGSSYTVSQYDYRFWEHKSQPRDFPPGHKNVEAYLGDKGSVGTNVQEVLAAIHSTPSWKSGQRFRECTNPPYNALKHQDGLGVTPDVVDLLNAGIKMLFFNGVNDLICNHVGNEIALENLQWDHQHDYQVAKRYGWKSPSTNQLGGYMKEFQNLMYLKVLNSGHMVPMDVPDVSLDMLRNLVFGISFDDFEQRLDRSTRKNGGNDCPIPPAPKVCEPCAECPSETSQINNNPSKCSSDDDELSNGDLNASSMTIALPNVKGRYVVATSVLLGVLILCACYFGQGCRKRKRKQTIPEYDMELSGPTGRSYVDDPQEVNELS